MLKNDTAMYRFFIFIEWIGTTIKVVKPANCKECKKK